MQSLWGRQVSDLAFADFVKTLVYIASKKSVKITFINRWYPSSRTCSVCGAVNEALNLRDRTWQCPSCHTQLDRDRNAAMNIYRVGASTRAGKGRKSQFAGQSLLIAQFHSYWEGTRKNPNPLGLGVCQR